jgi:PPK2 family polyphosphate:nucleotide phosphotransferase
MDYRELLIVEPGHKVRLKDVDPGYHGKHESHDKAQPEIDSHVEHMAALQELMYAELKHALLIVLQGIDTAGKDGVCWHVVKGMNPQGCSVIGFKQPSEAERAHDFLWRVHPLTPARGYVSVFNRSHYEDVLVVRVHKLVPKETWQQRYDVINEFERLLVLNNTAIIKFFLYISKDEQLQRFKQRLDDPAKHWKISEADYKEREFWDDYVLAYEDMLSKCSTKHAPWYIVPSNHKWFRNLAVSQIICATLTGLGMKLPEPSVDIAEIKKLYQQAAAEAAKGHRA